MAGVVSDARGVGGLKLAPALRRGGRWPVPVSYAYGARSVGGVRVVEEACIARGTEAQVRLNRPLASIC